MDKDNRDAANKGRCDVGRGGRADIVIIDCLTVDFYVPADHATTVSIAIESAQCLSNGWAVGSSPRPATSRRQPTRASPPNAGPNGALGLRWLSHPTRKLGQ